MRKNYLLYLIFSTLMAFSSKGEPNKIKNLIVPPTTVTDTAITVIWDKPIGYETITGYDVYANGNFVGNSRKTNYTINGLKPNTKYSVFIVTKDADEKNSANSKTLIISTKPSGKIFNILDYGAKPNSEIVNTQAIQAAIDACSDNGVVVIPSGTFISGAIFLKSNMTLYISKGGVLKGSMNRNDYTPLIKTRFEGWECETYASLITAGKLDSKCTANVKNISIRGEGKIVGGGSVLGKAMIDSKGLRGRGRLICLMNCENVNIQGLTIEESPCWTIHYTYCRNVTCHDLNISSTASNGDGIDPDSSVNSYIFNCTFSTSDDCIAIKSGKNPEGNKVAKPCKNIYISNCNFKVGHSLAIGSEISGGIVNVQVKDCEIGNLNYGFQIKTTFARGGYIKNVLVRDCNLQQIKIVTSVTYNNDGESAQSLTKLSDFRFEKLNMTNIKTDKPIIYLEGFDDIANYARNIQFKDIRVPFNSKVYVKHAKNVLFENVRAVDNQQPTFLITESIKIKN